MEQYKPERISESIDWTRDLESISNDDVIYKKQKIRQMFEEDPDLKNVLGVLKPRPLNKYKDKDSPTQEELRKRQEILDYNEKIKHDQIVPWLKLNGIQEEVLNFIMYEMYTERRSYDNSFFKSQYVIIMCIVHENDMDTEYGIPRTDLLGYIVKDLLNRTNVLGMHLELSLDQTRIMDGGYYCRELRFWIDSPNVQPGHMGMTNKYDKFRR